VIYEEVDFEESLNSDTKFINFGNTLANTANTSHNNSNYNQSKQ